MTTQTIDDPSGAPTAVGSDRGMLVLQYGVAVMAVVGALLLASVR